MAHDPLQHPELLIRRVYSYAAYRLGDGPDAEDATSEAFERALRYRDSFDPRKGEPATWLLGIARRCVDDLLSRRPAHIPDQIERAAPGDLETDALRRVGLQRAVAGLDQRDRELVALRYGADLTARQIGDLIGLRTNAVEVALHRALARLREGLAPPAEGENSEPTLDAVRV